MHKTVSSTSTLEGKSEACAGRGGERGKERQWREGSVKRVLCVQAKSRNAGCMGRAEGHTKCHVSMPVLSCFQSFALLLYIHEWFMFVSTFSDYYRYR